VRSRDWLEPWEPFGEPGAPDPIAVSDAFKARCGAWERQRHFDAAYGFGIFLRNGPFIGEVSLGSVQRGPFQSANVGYWIDEPHAGHGYMPEAVVLAMRYGFEELGLHRIEAAIVPRNKASRRVAEKLGMREEGHVRTVPPDPRSVGRPRALRDDGRKTGSSANRRSKATSCAFARCVKRPQINERPAYQGAAGSSITFHDRWRARRERGIERRPELVGCLHEEALAVERGAMRS